MSKRKQKYRKQLKKKPTKKDIEVVISNLINHLRVIEEKVVALDNIFGLYIKYKKDDTATHR